MNRLAVVLIAAFASAVCGSGRVQAGPFVGVRAMRPLASDMGEVYVVLPVVSAGVRMLLSEQVAVRAGLSGTWGAGGNGQFSMWEADARAGFEVELWPPLGLRFGPGLLLAFGSEQTREVDTLGRIVSVRDFGVAVGAGLRVGMRLARVGPVEVNLEAVGDLVTIPMYRVTNGLTVLRSLELTGVGVGVTAEWRRDDSKRRR